MAPSTPSRDSTGDAVERYRPLIEGCPHPVVLSQDGGRVELVNRAAVALFAAKDEELVGRRLPDLLEADLQLDSLGSEVEADPAVRTLSSVVARRLDGRPVTVDVGLNAVRSGDETLVLASFTDVSERQRHEDALRDEQARYHSLVEGLPLNVFFKDVEGRFTFANRGCLKLMDLQLEELVGHTDFEIFPRELAEKYRRDDTRVLTSGEVFEDVEEYRDSEGNRSYVQVLKAPVLNARGDVVGTQGMFWDVSPRKRAEQALLESESRKASILEAAFDGVLVFVEGGIVVEFNASAERIFGFEAEEMIHADFVERIIAPGSRDGVRDVIREIFEAPNGHGVAGMGAGRRLEIVATRADGSTLDVELSLRRIPAEERPAVVAFLRDVTDRKLAETALERERFLLHSLMDNVPDNVYFKDRDGLYLRINKAKARRSGLGSPEEGVGRSDFDFFQPEHAASALADERSVMRTGQPIVGKEEELSWPDGSTSWSSTTRVPLRDESGEIVGTFGISRDVTDRKRVQEALREAKEAAEAASRAKSDFLANTSHEIRTPMNAIIGMTQLLLDDGELTERQREFLSIVDDSAESLLTIINSILDFSKIESGHVEIVPEPFDVRESLGDAVKSLALRAHGKGLELAYHVAADVPPILVADMAKLRQVVVNLVGNAVKFTDEGEVVLDVTLESRDDESVVLHVVTRDTGIGIPPEQVAQVFEAFHQVDTSSTRRFGGTGLGLSISAHLVELVGGRIWAESEVGRGSTFHFTFPAVVGESKEPRPQAEALTGLRVLVVDDNATNRRILEEMLRSWGMSSECVESARSARLALQEGVDLDRRFDVVLSDVHMPEEDGFAVASHLRGQSVLSGTGIVMLTSGDRLEDADRCRELSVDRYLRKPVKPSELFNAIGAAVDDRRGPRESTGKTEQDSPKGRSLSVLVVEDSRPNQRLAIGLLERWGHTVASAWNGREAVEMLGAGHRYDIVLMDVQMPEMDGLEATRCVRNAEAESGGHVPIIAMTAHAMAEDRERCLASGMDGYVSKPIRPDVLQAAMDAAVNTRAEPTEENDVTSPPDGLIDWDAAMDIVGGDRELLVDVNAAFLEELDETMDSVRAAWSARDPDGLKKACHRLKGGLRSIAAPTPSAVAEKLEMAGAAGDAEGLDAVADDFEELERLLPAVRRELEEYRDGG